MTDRMQLAEIERLQSMVAIVPEEREKLQTVRHKFILRRLSEDEPMTIHQLTDGVLDNYDMLQTAFFCGYIKIIGQDTWASGLCIITDSGDALLKQVDAQKRKP